MTHDWVTVTAAAPAAAAMYVAKIARSAYAGSAVASLATREVDSHQVVDDTAVDEELEAAHRTRSCYVVHALAVEQGEKREEVVAGLHEVAHGSH